MRAYQRLTALTDPAVTDPTTIPPGTDWYNPTTGVTKTRSADGASWEDIVNVSGGSGALLSATVTLTNAQIKALPTTPITLLAAPGAGLAVIPISVVASLDNSAGAYTNVNADGYVSVKIGTDEVEFPFANESGTFSFLTDSFGSAGHYLSVNSAPSQANFAGWGVISNAFNRTAAVNGALTIAANNNSAGDFTGGNAANSLIVTVFYVVASV